jgi:phage terminase large subunit-like protein
MVRATIQAADRNAPVHLVTASRGKAVRAEPISVRYAQGQVHHVGRFGKLEDQLCAFSSAGYTGTGSPDHADAAIWALTHLFGADDGTGIIEFYRREAEGHNGA